MRPSCQLESLKNIYQIAAHNLKLAWTRMHREKTQQDTKVRTEDLIMIKTHNRKTFEPVYQGYYRVIKVRGNQLDVAPMEGGPTKTVHVKHAKVVLPVDRVVDSIPDYTKFGRKSKLTVNPEKIPDLNWELTTRISTLTLPTTTASCDNGFQQQSFNKVHCHFSCRNCHYFFNSMRKLLIASRRGIWFFHLPFGRGPLTGRTTFPPGWGIGLATCGLQGLLCGLT